LIRTRESEISVVYAKEKEDLDTHKRGKTVTISVPKFETVFVNWGRKVTAVHFGRSVVYSPTNAEHYAHIAKSSTYSQPSVNLSRLFDIPNIGSDRLAEMLLTRDKKLAEINAKLQPILKEMEEWKSVKFGNLENPYAWIVSIIVALVIATIVVVIVFVIRKKLCCKHAINDGPNAESLYEPMMNQTPTSFTKQGPNRAREALTLSVAGVSTSLPQPQYVPGTGDIPLYPVLPAERKERASLGVVEVAESEAVIYNYPPTKNQ